MNIKKIYSYFSTTKHIYPLNDVYEKIVDCRNIIFCREFNSLLLTQAWWRGSFWEVIASGQELGRVKNEKNGEKK